MPSRRNCTPAVTTMSPALQSTGDTHAILGGAAEGNAGATYDLAVLVDNKHCWATGTLGQRRDRHQHRCRFLFDPQRDRRRHTQPHLRWRSHGNAHRIGSRSRVSLSGDFPDATIDAEARARPERNLRPLSDLQTSGVLFRHGKRQFPSHWRPRS